MKKLFIVIITISFCLSCKKANKESSDIKLIAESGKKFEMYKRSEMALLMEQIYVTNKRLKKRIIEGDTIGKFPNFVLKIQSAKMTDKQERDVFFTTQAGMFIQSQKLIYEDSKNAKKNFNSSIDECLKCHEVKCGGPIPRIKKLYIK